MFSSDRNTGLRDVNWKVTYGNDGKINKLGGVETLYTDSPC